MTEWILTLGLLTGPGFDPDTETQRHICGYHARPPSPQQPAAYQKLRPQFIARWLRLQRAAFQAGIPLAAGSTWRSRAEQARLYRQKGPRWAARPGRSNHEKGLAIDMVDMCRRTSVKRGTKADRWLNRHVRSYSLRRPMAHEPWHIEPLTYLKHTVIQSIAD